MELNLLGNDEIDDLDFDYIPINNLPVSYFPFKDVVLLNELKKINNENLNYGIPIPIEPITITSVYKLLVKKKIKLMINTKEILFEKGVYIFYNNLNGFDIVKKNNREFYKAPHTPNVDILLSIVNTTEAVNIANISSTQNYIELSNIQLETADNPDYKLIVYKNNGTLTLYQDIICDILLVGGGGNGGWYGGGGGGGGVIEYLEYSLKSDVYTITIGNINSNNGNTTIKKDNDKNFLLGAGGGGNGGGQNKTASNGNIVNNISGGGGGGRGDTYGTIKGGKNGGSGFKGEISGGGGGAGGLGEDGNENKSGDGGNGKLSKITNKYYGGGGGGAYYKGEVGKGGKGGGGKGGSINSGSLINTGDEGETNTGGGGGGTTRLGGGGFGGSGIVIIRVANKYIESINDSELISSYDTRIINDINNELNKKIIEFNNNDKPYNYLGIYPLIILILFIWIFIFLFLLKFVHHYFTSIYLYILIGFIIILLIFGSMWFLYTNNDLL